MGALGIGLGMICLYVGISLLTIGYKYVAGVVGFITLLCIGMIIYDASSPTEITVSYIQTTDIEVYNLEESIELEEGKMYTVIKEVTEATRPGAILFDIINYKLKMQ